MTRTTTATDADAARFRTDGWLVVDDVFTPDECDVMNATLEPTAFADRLLVARDGAWLDEPIRERELDLLATLANHDRS